MVRAAISVAAASQESATAEHSFTDLRVTAVCKCGCASVSFGPEPPPGTSRPVADCIGSTPSGGDVGVLVWASSERLTGLEIYDLGAGQEDLVLPLPESLRPFPKEVRENSY